MAGYDKQVCLPRYPFAAHFLIAPAPADTQRVVHVINGDIIQPNSYERIRIAGIDAPETRNG